MNLSLDAKAFHVARVEAGYLTMAALARAAELSGGYLRQVAAGLVPPERTRAKIAAALKVEPSTLWKVRAS